MRWIQRITTSSKRFPISPRIRIKQLCIDKLFNVLESENERLPSLYCSS